MVTVPTLSLRQAGHSGWFKWFPSCSVVLGANYSYDSMANYSYDSMFCLTYRNPTKGIVINRPNGTDVYAGVPKDYTKEVGMNHHSALASV